MVTGLVIGRFCPPHLGHSHLIQEAADFDDPQLWERWMAILRAAWPLERGPDVIFSTDRAD